jgi:hypothetical protein
MRVFLHPYQQTVLGGRNLWFFDNITAVFFYDTFRNKAFVGNLRGRKVCGKRSADTFVWFMQESYNVQTKE